MLIQPIDFKQKIEELHIKPARLLDIYEEATRNKRFVDMVTIDGGKAFLELDPTKPRFDLYVATKGFDYHKEFAEKKTFLVEAFPFLNSFIAN